MFRVQAEENRIGDFDQRVIDLEIEEGFDPSIEQTLQESAAGQRGKHAAMAIRARKKLMRRIHEELARGQVDRGHGSLLEKVDILFSQAEVALFAEELAGFRIGRWAGHYQKRNRASITILQGPDFLNVDLEERSLGDRANWVHPLGMLESEPTPLSARNHQRRDLASRQHGFAARLRGGRGSGCRKHGRRLNAILAGNFVSFVAILKQGSHHIQIKCRDFGQE